MIYRFLFYTLIGVLVIGCSSSSDEETELIPISFVGIAMDFNSLEIESSKRLTVVTNQEEFQQEWLRLSLEQAPFIDFESLNVVIAEMGTQSGTGVAQIIVESVAEGIDHTKVNVTTFLPGAGCTEDAALSTPFHVVSVESKNTFLFSERLDTVNCN